MGRLKEELHSRQIRRYSKDDKYEIVGTEIKKRRKNRSQTLEALSEDICSLSYLCKIEKNQIEPNKSFLREICSRLELSDDKIDYLFELKETIANIIRAYLVEDYNFVEYAFASGEGLENYRYDIIKLAYYISKKDIKMADIINSRLMSITTSMSDYDIAIYSIFASILATLKYDFKEALDDIEYLDPNYIGKEAALLKAILEFKIHFAMNMADTPAYFENAKRLAFEYGYYSLIEGLKYYMAHYYIKNKCDQSYEAIVGMMTNKKLINSLRLIYAFFNNNIPAVINIDDNLNEYASVLKMLCTEFKSAKKLIKENYVDYYRFDYDELLLEYLSLDVRKQKYDFIFKKGLPLATKYDDKYLCDYFISELSKVIKKTISYKSFLNAYQMVNGIIDRDDFEVMENEE